MALDPSTLSALGDLSIVAMLIGILIGGARGDWVFGWQYKRQCEETERWRSLALNGTSIADRAVRLADHATKQAG